MRIPFVSKRFAADSPDGVWGAFGRTAARRRAAGLVLLAGLAILVGAAAYALAEWQGSERDNAEAAFRERAEVASNQIESFLISSLPAIRQALDGAPGSERPAPTELHDLFRTQLGVWLLDRRGRVIEASPGAPKVPTDSLRNAIEARASTVTGAITSATGEDAVRIAVPIHRSDRIAGIVATYPLSFARMFVGPAIEQIPATTGSRASVIDRDGTALTSSGLDDAAAMKLATRAVDSRFGSIETDDGTYLYASSPVAGAPWMVVLTGPRSELLAGTDAPAGWAGWPALVAFAISGVLGILLLMRVLRDAARLEGFSRDLERQKLAAEAATRAKNEHIASLTHELRTPLAAIRMFAELLGNDAEQPLTPGQRRTVEDIAAGTRHVLDLLDDTMDIARVEQGRLELRPDRVSVAALAIGIVDSLRPLASERHVQLSLEADSGIGEVYLDPSRLRQVMINFLSNALKFTAPDGTATMRLSRQGPSSFVISVEDTGIGIAEDQRAGVFTSTARRARPVRDQDTTRGLGLALTKRIVEAMGGYVGVESELGRGSTFYAVLPRVNAARRAGLDAADGASGESVRLDTPPIAVDGTPFSSVGVRLTGRGGSNGEPQADPSDEPPPKVPDGGDRGA